MRERICLVIFLSSPGERCLYGLGQMKCKRSHLHVGGVHNGPEDHFLSVITCMYLSFQPKHARSSPHCIMNISKHHFMSPLPVVLNLWPFVTAWPPTEAVSFCLLHSNVALVEAFHDFEQLYKISSEEKDPVLFYLHIISYWLIPWISGLMSEERGFWFNM